jgi:sodium/potassium-transporting ATPase subunit alpha
MSVTECSFGTQTMTSEEAQQTKLLERPSDADASNILDQLAALAGLCNAGEFDATTMHLPLEKRNIIGDATDQAILRFAESLTSVSALRNEWKKIFEMAFNSKNKFMIRVLEAAEAKAGASLLSTEECKALGEGDL